jgi:HK97 family phage portal protein
VGHHRNQQPGRAGVGNVAVLVTRQQVSPLRSILSRLGQWLTRTAWMAPVPPMQWGHTWWGQGYGSPHAMPPLITFPAVFTSIDTISSDIARLPFRHYRLERGGEKIEVESSAALRVLEHPNGYQTRWDLMKQFVASQLYRGNGYLFAKRNGRYEIDELHVIFPDHVWPYRSGGEVFYQVAPDPLAGIEVQRMLTTRECLHHRMLTLQDPLIGITPLMAAALSTSAGMAILKQSESFFRQMARPSGVLQTAGKIDPARAQEIKERWQSVYKGPDNAGDVAVLEFGLEWKPMTMTAVDAQLIEQLRYSVEDVARVYRLPIFMLGDLTRVSYSSSEQLTRIYYSGCLASHLGAIEERFSAFFDMNPRTEWLEFDLDVLFRTEMLQRIEALAKAVQGGIRTPNEARSVEGLNPLPGGDTVFMQQQMVPVEVLASRTDLTAKPPTGPMPPNPTAAALPAPAPQLALPAPAASSDALRDALMGEVFRDGPPVRRAAVPPDRRPQRKLIHGRRSRIA